MKTKRIKARKLYAVSLTEAMPCYGIKPEPHKITLAAVWELPADAESYERMMVQMTRANYETTARFPWDGILETEQAAWLAGTHAALAAIGITRPKDKRK